MAGAYYTARERLEAKKSDNYGYEAPDDGTLAKQRFETSAIAGVPLITIVMPAFNPPERYFRKAVESVIGQSYVNWRLVIGDASDSDHPAAERIAGSYGDDKRIEYIRLKSNEGISGNTNNILKHIPLSEDEYIGLLDHDDELTPDALYYMATEIVKALSETKTYPVLLYSDEDKIYEDEGTGEISYFDCHVKYDYNYDLLLTNNYICHLMLIRSDILEKMDFRREYDGAQDYDMVLRIAQLKEKSPSGDMRILHVPRVLYHWRSHPGSTATNSSSKSYAYEAGLRALQEHLDGTYGAGAAKAYHSKHLGFYCVEWTPEESSATDKLKRKRSKPINYERYISDIFSNRDDIAGVIGRVIDSNGQMSKCIYNENREALFYGLNKHYSGPFNRFDCTQDVYAADIRYLTMRPELTGFVENIAHSGIIAHRDEASEAELEQASFELAEEIHRRGLKILYDPDIVIYSHKA